VRAKEAAEGGADESDEEEDGDADADADAGEGSEKLSRRRIKGRFCVGREASLWRSEGVEATNLAWESEACLAISEGWLSGLVVVMTPPTAMTAKVRTGKSMVLGERRRTTSPGRSRRRCEIRAAATRWTRLRWRP
jgi:hypothetical protein